MGKENLYCCGQVITENTSSWKPYSRRREVEKEASPQA